MRTEDVVGEVVDFVILILLYFWVFYKKWRAKGKDVLLANTLMYVYLVFVLYFTLMPIITSLPFIFDHPYVPMNLEPFIDVVAGWGDFERQIVLNVVMTIPFGFLLPLVKKNKAGLSKVILYTFLLSLGIELVQPLLSGLRLSDVTDIITNVAGGVIGYAIYLAMEPLTKKFLGYIGGRKV